MTTMSNDSGIVSSVVGQPPEITAPVRLEGQSDPEVLFAWMRVNRFLWMIESPHDDELQQITGTSTYLDLAFCLVKWKREQGRRAVGHEAMVPPEDDASRRAAHSRLRKLIDVHLFDSRGSADG